MSNSAHVVDGEASESDTEIEIGISPDSNLSPNTETFVIAGEAPESDEGGFTFTTLPLIALRNQGEITVHLPSNLDAPLNLAMNQPSPSKIYTSLLHQKLWECNVSLRASIEGLFKHTTDISAEKLSRADKALLNVQESMRATNANLILARARLKQLEVQLQELNCGSALPTVKIKT
ncbi:unnamed protein product [Diatraea saccharalis]|uniref:Biogenesis of lysosome-related organelles complex 1 subunit 3 n=1 Tax=Diatraea saccharalis TaxID=40085 RepID=A0A9N9WD29_9NEOP|nr:unnamed protein product [Diatraea saccharalis]